MRDATGEDAEAFELLCLAQGLLERPDTSASLDKRDLLIVEALARRRQPILRLAQSRALQQGGVIGLIPLPLGEGFVELLAPEQEAAVRLKPFAQARPAVQQAFVRDLNRFLAG